MDRIDKVTTALGCLSDPRRADLLGLSTRTITRARNGQGIGTDFVAQTLAVVRRHRRVLAGVGFTFPLSFDGLFEVVIPPVGAPGDRRAA